MELNLIYHFQSSRNEEGQFKGASYRVISFFSDEGFIEDQLLKEKALAFTSAETHTLSFQSLDELKEFALEVTRHLGARMVRLISAQDYNIGVDGARDLESYRQIFAKYGEVVENPEARKKKGLLGKLFS